MENKNNSMLINQTLTEQILEKLGFTNSPPLNKNGLEIIYKAWCRSVPFDNIRKRILIRTGGDYILPGSTPTDFFVNWLRHGTGGTCWAGHGALYSLLKQLGFSVQFGISTMLSNPPPAAESPGHGTLAVKFDNDLFIVDATIFHDTPLPLADWTSDHPVWGTRVHHDRGFWHINWKPLGRPRVDCRLFNLNALPEEYPHRHELSRSNSRFDGALLIRMANMESITGIVKGEKVIRDSSGKESFQTLTHNDQKKLLVEHFKISEELVDRVPENDLLKI
ncbi:arylamine N-acetyltransferase [Klebsiella aerogenes]|uniref:arylamine N-acetyltransferase n=1 Tax=Klebsiella aerogenes TaxID=548 RepID=UPI000A6D091A|nr:arylamine N-acetyltransferase [Klebsiella aerogenes]MDU9141153.1 arylamine N-acetyltransferase [Klebsiella aerogenes]UNX72095.1 arylamine N-acetyltransferase [Klebsiella aerogenes]